MNGPLALTVTGKRFNPLDVRVEDIHLETVAHHLALINRFNGATLRPISVAQHAVYVSRLLDGTGLEWQGLHHDDGEAYVGDMVKWLKEDPAMESFRKAEERAQFACYEFFGVPPSSYIGYPKHMHPLVELADKLMLRWEGSQSFPKGVWEAWTEEIIKPFGYKPVSATEREWIGPWKPWSWRQAKQGYLDHYNLLRRAGAHLPRKFYGPGRFADVLSADTLLSLFR